ncbi:unnamed protein product [Linum trigynum]|uniref:Uncharacterized protein n=1 Tax=Linum trigynum TaxID=586398 RepID=A0AAV2F6Y9_9ROSI
MLPLGLLRPRLLPPPCSPLGTLPPHSNSAPNATEIIVASVPMAVNAATVGFLLVTAVDSPALNFVVSFPPWSDAVLLIQTPSVDSPGFASSLS